MRELRMLALAGALAAVGIGTAASPAAADQLGVDFVSPPTGNSCAPTLECNGFLTYGFAFTVGSATASVTALGTFDDGSLADLNLSGGATTVGLWNTSGALLASIVIGAGADQVGLWAFATLPTSVLLAANTTYIVGSQGDGAYLAGSVGTTSLDISVDPIITYVGGQSSTAETFEFPNQASSATFNPGFFGGNLEIDPIPEPMSLSLFGAALAGFGLLRRRKKA